MKKRTSRMNYRGDELCCTVIKEIPNLVVAVICERLKVIPRTAALDSKKYNQE